MRFLFMAFFFSASASATTLEVRYLARNFSLQFNQKSISIDAPDMKLSLEKKSCSKKIFADFQKSLDRHLALEGNQEGEMVEITLNGKKISESVESRKGRYFVTLSDEVKRMKLEEAIRCK